MTVAYLLSLTFTTEKVFFFFPIMIHTLIVYVEGGVILMVNFSKSISAA